jgi:hypothetical protein
MRAMRSRIVSRHIASWALKLATSRMVFSLSSSLKRASKRGRSSACSLSSMLRYSKTASMLASTSGGVEFELLLVGDHRLDDPVAQQVELARSASIRVCSQSRVSLLAVFARFDAELMLAERLVAHAIEALEVRRLCGHPRLDQQRLCLRAQGGGIALPLLERERLSRCSASWPSSALSAATTSRSAR